MYPETDTRSIRYFYPPYLLPTRGICKNQENALSLICHTQKKKYDICKSLTRQELYLKQKQPLSIFYRLLPYLIPHWKAVSIGLLCLLISIPAGNFHPLVWAYIVDVVIGKHKYGLLIPVVALMFVVQALGTLLEAIRSNILGKVAQKMVYKLRNDVYSKLQGQSISYLHNNRTGDIISRAMGDVDVLREVAVQGTDSIIANVLSFVYISAILLRLNWKLGIVTLLPISLVFILTRQYRYKVRKLYRDARDQLGIVNARLQENLTGMIVIKGFAREKAELLRFQEETMKYLHLNIRAINAQTVFFPSVRLIGFLSNVVSVGFGTWLIIHHQFTLGGLVAYRGYWFPLFAPVNQLAGINELLQRAQAAGSRVFEVLDEKETVQDIPDAKELIIKKGRVEFRHVSFSYNVKPALQDVSFVAEPGQMVSFVGPSGAGKTTVLSLIPRFYDPQEGAIYIDDQDIAHVTQESLRQHLAIVQQETFLFNGTILDNIRYGRPEATMEETQQAVRAANAEDFILDMQDGYMTEIGERGVKLSGGQRQRLSIARAFLSNPEILILDEPTSNVEPESEWIITQALERLMKGRTTFVTSHRFSLIRGADKIIVLDQGRLVEEGSQEELMELRGLYSSMYRQQMAI
jgi:ABC-type multidrug transport system fused ATPase/permease subunit